MIGNPVEMGDGETVAVLKIREDQRWDDRRMVQFHVCDEYILAQRRRRREM